MLFTWKDRSPSLSEPLSLLYTRIICYGLTAISTTAPVKPRFIKPHRSDPIAYAAIRHFPNAIHISPYACANRSDPIAAVERFPNATCHPAHAQYNKHSDLL